MNNEDRHTEGVSRRGGAGGIPERQEKAKAVLLTKRSMASGYAGIENELVFFPNTIMLFGDAKKVVEEIVQTLA